jgi:hypothetical protein
MCLIWQFLFMQVLAKATNGAAISSTLAAGSYVSRMHGKKGDLLKFCKKGAKSLADWERSEITLKTPRMEAL